jgi:predicted RNase H-like nuclease
MALIAGVDGCKIGWLCMLKNTESGYLKSHVFRSIVDLLHRHPSLLIISIDIPIGLTDSGARQCDIIARKLLGQPRGCSVFPAPIRPSLKAKSWEEANELSRSIDNKGITKQSWGIYPKIIEVDTTLYENQQLRKIFKEVHPELSFMEWNRGAPIIQPKRKKIGKLIRSALVDRYFGSGAFQLVRREYLKKYVADDDINDAFAALWSAERIHKDIAKKIPDIPVYDSYGIEMVMRY